MKKSNISILMLAASVVAVLFIGCQKAANSNAAANQSSNANAANANKPVADKTPDAKTEFSLATPTDAYKTAWAIREKKDVEGMKKVMSKDILEFLADIGKDEKKTVDDEIRAMFESPQAKTAEARNEKITGETATIEYTDETGEWQTMDFIKEGNDWKLTLNKADKPPTDAPGKKK